MTTGKGLAAYGRVLTDGRAVRPFAAAVTARLPFSMAPLGIVLLIASVRGTYGIAGVVTGAYALGTAVGAPVWGRSMDRFGQPRVILPTTLVSALLLVGLALAAVAGAGNVPLLVLATASGIAFPPVGPGMRAAWRVVFPDEATRRAGYALDASAVELIFVGGPLLLSLLLIVSPPVVPLLVTAGLLLAGGTAYGCSSAARAWRPTRASTAGGVRHGRSAVSAPGVLAVLAVVLVMSIGFGQLDTSLAATARQILGDPAELGVLFAAIAGGSTIGGISYGARSRPAREHRWLPVTLGGFGLGLVPIPLLLLGGRPPLTVLLPLLFLTGLFIAPALIIQQNLLDALAPAHQVNEAQALLSAANTSGGAAGAAIAGLLIDAGGPTWSFTGAMLAVLGAATVALAGQRRWRTLTARPGRTDRTGGPAAAVPVLETASR